MAWTTQTTVPAVADTGQSLFYIIIVIFTILGLIGNIEVYTTLYTGRGATPEETHDSLDKTVDCKHCYLHNRATISMTNIYFHVIWHKISVQALDLYVTHWLIAHLPRPFTLVPWNIPVSLDVLVQNSSTPLQRAVRTRKSNEKRCPPFLLASTPP